MGLMDALRLGASFGRVAEVNLLYKRKADCEKSQPGNYFRYDTCYDKNGKEVRPSYNNGGRRRRTRKTRRGKGRRGGSSFKKIKCCTQADPGNYMSDGVCYSEDGIKTDYDENCIINSRPRSKTLKSRSFKNSKSTY